MKEDIKEHKRRTTSNERRYQEHKRRTTSNERRYQEHKRIKKK